MMEDLYQNIKGWGKWLETFFETRSTTEIVFRILFGVATFAIFLAELHDATQPEPRHIPAILLVIILICLLIIDYGHLRLAKRRLLLLREKDENIKTLTRNYKKDLAIRNKALRDMVEHLVDIQVQEHTVKRTINIYGDAFIERTDKFTSKGRAVVGIPIQIGLTDDENIINSDSLQFSAQYKSSNGVQKQAEHILIGDGKLKRYVVLFDTPLIQDEVVTLTMSWRVKSAWVKLFEDLSDEGELRVLFPTQSHKTTFQLPYEYGLAGFSLVPMPTGITLLEGQNRHVFEVVLNNPPVGNYTYRIKVKMITQTGESKTV